MLLTKIFENIELQYIDPYAYIWGNTKTNYITPYI